jgi:hypothetical protein
MSIGLPYSCGGRRPAHKFMGNYVSGLARLLVLKVLFLIMFPLFSLSGNSIDFIGIDVPKILGWL